jgi:hypothetical protein
MMPKNSAEIRNEKNGTPADPSPGRYCCLSPQCDHAREQVFNGGGGDDG